MIPHPPNPLLPEGEGGEGPQGYRVRLPFSPREKGLGDEGEFIRLHGYDELLFRDGPLVPRPRGFDEFKRRPRPINSALLAATSGGGDPTATRARPATGVPHLRSLVYSPLQNSTTGLDHARFTWTSGEELPHPQPLSRRERGAERTHTTCALVVSKKNMCPSSPRLDLSGSRSAPSADARRTSSVGAPARPPSRRREISPPTASGAVLRRLLLRSGTPRGGSRWRRSFPPADSRSGTRRPLPGCRG